MSLEISKLRASNITHLFGCQSFKVCIANVGCPSLQIIEFSKEDKEPQASMSDNSRVNTVNRDVGEVSISYKSRLVFSIMLDVINEMNMNLLEALWNVDTFAFIMEAVAVVKLDHFKTGCINPFV
jgi:hypothetical protein